MKVDHSKIKQHRISDLREERKTAEREWSKSSRTLFVNPSYAGDRRNNKVGSKFKCKVEITNKDKSERLRRLRLGLNSPHVVDETTQSIMEETKPTLEEHLKRIRALKESTSRVKGQQSNIREGFLYVVVNPAWPNWVKVGQTTDYESRLRTYQTSSPHVDYSMVFVQYVRDSLLEEQKILELASQRYQVRGEWVNCSVTEIAGMM